MNIEEHRNKKHLWVTVNSSIVNAELLQGLCPLHQGQDESLIKLTSYFTHFKLIFKGKAQMESPLLPLNEWSPRSSKTSQTSSDKIIQKINSGLAQDLTHQRQPLKRQRCPIPAVTGT